MIQGVACRCQQFLALCKLRVVSLIVFTAVIGMFLAVPGWPSWNVLWAGTLGIALVAGAAAAFNCLIEQKIDAVMARTRARPLPRGELTNTQTLVFSGVVGGLGLYLLNAFVNPLTIGSRWPLCRLCGDLYGAAETGHATEHRDRRRFRRNAAGAGLGGSHRRDSP
jgi:protoheme IX farnesyltransferase